MALLSRVYDGDIMVAVQRLCIFEDCKTFVDMPITTSPADVVAAWDALPAADRGDAGVVARFVASHFDAAGGELEVCAPADWTAELPASLVGISDDSRRKWASDVHGLWKVLGRRVRAGAPQASSFLLPPGAAFIIPGGRFRELYYWDSLWIIRGLVVSGMLGTAEAMTRNLLGLCRAHGFVPNGARSYYLDRSQPPLLTEMVAAVVEALGADGRAARLARDALPDLDAEAAFWNSGPRKVQLPGGHALARYHSSRTTPRPESYRDDVATAAHASAEQDRAQMYCDLATAAESGWDFSTRWMRRWAADDDATVFFAEPRHARLARTAATRVVPVDLNAMLLRAEMALAKLHGEFGDAAKAAGYAEAAAKREAAISAVLWHEPSGRWRDFWLDGAQPLFDAPHASDFAPLWAGCADDWPAEAKRRVVAALAPLVSAAGLLTTTVSSGEQWDAPNCWPPLQAIAVDGLKRLGDAEADALAANIAEAYVSTAHAAFETSGAMHEKYAADGGGGGGGEYASQVGFGWSNGVALEFLAHRP